MREPEISNECQSIWQRLIEADAELLQAQYAAFRIASLISDVEQRKTLFQDFLALACQPTYGPTIISGRDAILSLPRDWVAANLEREAANLLDWDDAWEYRRFLELCSLIDSEMTDRIAQKAATHQNSESGMQAKTF